MVASLEFASGALGCVEASTAAYPGALKRLEICGSQGSAIVEEQNVRAQLPWSQYGCGGGSWDRKFMKT